MTDLQKVVQAVDELSASELKQLLQHILETKIQVLDAEKPIPSPRIAGLHEHLGHSRMRDDFNSELPDSFWLGESGRFPSTGKQIPHHPDRIEQKKGGTTVVPPSSPVRLSL
jgi:hypothetical protein